MKSGKTAGQATHHYPGQRRQRWKPEWRRDPRSKARCRARQRGPSLFSTRGRTILANFLRSRTRLADRKMRTFARRSVTFWKEGKLHSASEQGVFAFALKGSCSPQPDSKIRSPLWTSGAVGTRNPVGLVATVFPEFIARDGQERADGGRQGEKHRVGAARRRSRGHGPARLDGTRPWATVADKGMKSGKMAGPDNGRFDVPTARKRSAQARIEEFGP